VKRPVRVGVRVGVRLVYGGCKVLLAHIYRLCYNGNVLFMTKRKERSYQRNPAANTAGNS